MSGIRTSRRNHVFIVQKRVGKEWERITDAIFDKRSNARECSRELNALSRGRRYRVVKLGIVAPRAS